MNAARTVSESAPPGADLPGHERRVGRDPSPSPKSACSDAVLKSTGYPSRFGSPLRTIPHKINHVFRPQARRLRKPGRIFSGAHAGSGGSLIGRRSGHDTGRFGWLSSLQITLDAAVRCAVPRPSQPALYISISEEPKVPLSASTYDCVCTRPIEFPFLLIVESDCHLASKMESESS